MKSKRIIGLLAGLLVVGATASAAQKTAFEVTKGKALELHRSLIGYAAPQVKAKIAASAQAAKDYLANCGRECDLHAFLAKDLKARFARTTGEQFQLLEALVFAEAFKDMSELDQMRLQDTMERQAQLMQLMSNISKMVHDTLKGIIQNMR